MLATPLESQLVQTSQVLPATQVIPIDAQPQVSQLYTLAPEVQQVTPVVSQVLPTVSMPPVVSQVVPTVSIAPQVSQMVPTVSMAPQVSQMVPTTSMAPSMVSSQMPVSKPLTPSPPYTAFIPPTPVPKSVVESQTPQIYQYYQSVQNPTPPVQMATAITTSYVNVPVTTSVNVPVTSSINVPVTNSYSTFTEPVPSVPATTGSLLLGTAQYQTNSATLF